MKHQSVTIQIKAIKKYFPVVLFIILHKVVLTFESVDKTLMCDHSKVIQISCGTVYYAVQDG